jgi:flagellar protein FliS
MRSANTYKTVGLETSVSGASPHQLVSLLFDGVLQSLTAARGAIVNRDFATKGRSIGRVVRILEEGLKASLDAQRGGEVAATLLSLYDFCIFKITEANLRNDVAMVDEVISLIQPVADGWNQIRSQVSGPNYLA